MKHVKQYILNTLGIEIQPQPIANQQLGKLPMYISQTYKLYQVQLFNHLLLLAEPNETTDFSIFQTEKNFDLLKTVLGIKTILILPEITAFNRKRLIEKGINFIVPGKQMYLPDLLIDLRETYSDKKSRHRKTVLLPSAQFIVLYYLLHRNEYKKMEAHTFKELAEKFGYTQMAITKAIDNLKHHELCTAEGTKEKFIRFNYETHELWTKALPLMVNPVLKTVYVDQLPKDIFMLHGNATALPEYTDMNPSRQEYYAIEKNVFYALQKTGALVNHNEHEGRFCLEVWKYNPEKLTQGITTKNNVDPLSLYLSFKDSKDERIEMALEKIIEQHITN